MEHGGVANLYVTGHDLPDTKTIQVWETAGKNGLITANLMWPGPPVTVNGISHNYFVPFKVFLNFGMPG